MGLSDIGARLPPGFKFNPSDDELVCYYLYDKIYNKESLKGTTLIDVDLHTCEPWQLPDEAKLNVNEWYFFSFRDRKYATGFRTNRATTTGYWKATGRDRMVHDPVTKEIVGMRKTLVFYRNRAPNGIKTGWIMHEFRLVIPCMPPKADWVLCRVFGRTKSQEHNHDNNINIIDETLSPQQFHMFDSNNLSNPLINRPSVMSPPPFHDLYIDNNNPAASSSSLLQLHDTHLEIESSKVEDDLMIPWDESIVEESRMDYGAVSSSSDLSCLDMLHMDF